MIKLMSLMRSDFFSENTKTVRADITVLLLLLLLTGGFVVIPHWVGFLYVVLLVVLLLLFYRLPRIYIIKGSFYRFLCFFILFLVLECFRGESIFHADNLEVLLKSLIAFLALIYFVSARDSKYLFELFIKLTEWMIILSTIVLILASLTPFLMVTYYKTELGNSLLTWLGVGYFNMFHIQKYGFLRNQGLYWEPGVFGVFTIIAYVIKEYCYRNKEHAWIYCLGIISSMSMGSMLIFSAVFVHKKIMLDKYEASHFFLFIVKAILILSILSIATGLLFFHDDFMALLSWIFQRDVSSDGSIKERLVDLQYGFIASLSTPLFGHGSGLEGLQEYYDLTLSELNISKEFFSGGITNAIVGLLYKYGFIFTCFYLGCLYFFSSLISRGKHAFFIFIVMIMCLMLEPLHLGVFFLMLLFSDEGGEVRLRWN